MYRACPMFALALLLALGGVASAQTNPEKELARKRYKVGEQLYDIGQYEKALVEFEEAYRLYPLPAMLYNIARAHEVLGNLQKAIGNYQEFLAKLPDSPHAPTVKGRVKSLRQRLDKKKAAQSKQPPAAAPVEEPAPADTPRTWRWTAGWAGVGVGGAALAAGIAFGAMAAGKSSEFEQQRDRGESYKSLKALRESGEQYETIGIALMVSGGVIAAAGGALLIWELMGDEKEPNMAGAVFAPVVTSDGAGITARLSF